MVLIVKIPADTTLEITEENIDEHGGDAIPSYLESSMNGDVVIDVSVLIRHSEESTGVYGYTISSTIFSADVPNLRATTLAMACGLHSKRFTNDVYIGRLGYTSSGLRNIDLSIRDIIAAIHTPDLRKSFMKEMNLSGVLGNEIYIEAAPHWLCSGAQKNYHDNKSMTALAVAMARAEVEDENSESCSNSDAEVKNIPMEKCTTQNVAMKSDLTLCLHCRRSASTFCMNCKGAYFCEEPRKCKLLGWSHDCVCKTWKLYVQRRDMLSYFPYFSGWQLPLLQDDCYSSDQTYKQYLMYNIKVLNAEKNTDGATVGETNWWSTEIHGWNGGNSASAKLVDLYQRVSYRDGLSLDMSLIPDEIPYSNDAMIRAGISVDQNHVPILSSWEDYYRLRSLPPMSPIALLATFPLTVHYAIQKHGVVPVTVAKMLERPMRVHLVGIEKELNFIDFFRELGFLIPIEVQIEMSWIIREDMFPEAFTRREKNGDTKLLSLHLTNNLKLSVISGTYGDSLDPNFDIDGGAPDMIIGLNAGLYAYESWRHVVSYLDKNRNVVGVFTDYNEHSGMNCASLGGTKSRDSLRVNPFRQPRAMPVNCMNLPQFSNGFMYVFNEQELE